MTRKNEDAKIDEFFRAGYEKGYSDSLALYGNMQRKNDERDDAVDEGVLAGKTDARKGSPKNPDKALLRWKRETNLSDSARETESAT
jgi:hypothetical protein